MRKDIILSAVVVCAVGALVGRIHDAQACGGCFHPETQTPEQASVITSHRMALSISTTQTVLWDQVEYAGSPAEFAWVLPIKPGAYLEVASDAWFETLDAATTVQVNAPQLACPTPDYGGMSCGPGYAAGCSSDDTAGADMGGADLRPPPPDPVTVVHQGSVGPYETVTLHSDVQGALADWLQQNGFRIDEQVQPIIDAYASNGFDFIALRLLPQAGVQQMKPVRVVQPGAVPTLPLRMVAAGTGATVQLTLFVIGESRWATQSFPGAVVDPQSVSWDFLGQRSTYAELRDTALAQENGRVWLTSYSQKGALLSHIENPVIGGATQYIAGAAVTTTIAEAFVQQALANGEAGSTSCAGAFAGFATSTDVVVNPCPIEDGGTCKPLLPGQLNAQQLVCSGPVRGTNLDDLAVALTGMHPRDVWVTRLEANLPRAALDQDLNLEGANEQTPVGNWIVAGQATNNQCPVASAAAAAQGGAGSSKPPGGSRRAAVAFGLLACFALASWLRRIARPASRGAAARV